MLPSTARPNDIVEVVNVDHSYYGSIGRIVKREGEDHVRVEIYGKHVNLHVEDLKMRARVGTRSHEDLNQRIKDRTARNLTQEDYNDLINLAIDVKDWDWAQELIAKKNKRKKRR